MSKRGGWRGKRKRDDDSGTAGPGPGRKPDDDPMDMVPKVTSSTSPNERALILSVLFFVGTQVK